MFRPEQGSGISPIDDKRESILREALPFVRKAEEKAGKVLREAAINPWNFIYPYGEEVVRKDIEWTEKLEAEHRRLFDVNKMNADIIEAILYEHIEQSNWFGENARTIKTSRFDDFRNGVDFIVELEEAVEGLLHLGLAVDVTFGEVSLQEKIQKIKQEIENGKLTEIKYFESERSPYKEIYKKLPQVVIGVDRRHMFDLMRLWVDDARKKEFATHPAQMVILHEIVSQLIRFAQHAEQCGQEEVADIYTKQRRVFQYILHKKQDENNKSYEQDDGVHTGILKQLKLFA